MKTLIAVALIISLGVFAYRLILLDENSIHNTGLNSMQNLVTTERQVP